MSSNQNKLHFHMGNPEKYEIFNLVQANDTKIALKRFRANIMKLRRNCKILDVGCGPGTLTTNHLLPLIPEHGQLVGIDVSKAMIDFASSKYQNSKQKFEVMDITDKIAAEKYRAEFNIIFSFYCFHWIQDQKSAMENIYNMLVEGGETMMIFCSNTTVYPLFEGLACSEKWNKYTRDYRRYISPYYDCKDPVKTVRDLMVSVGFRVNLCKLEERTFSMPNLEIMFEASECVDPFLKDIPRDLLQKYREDKKRIIEEKKLYTFDRNSNFPKFSYSLITLIATK